MYLPEILPNVPIIPLLALSIPSVEFRWDESNRIYNITLDDKMTLERPAKVGSVKGKNYYERRFHRIEGVSREPSISSKSPESDLTGFLQKEFGSYNGIFYVDETEKALSFNELTSAVLDHLKMR